MANSKTIISALVLSALATAAPFPSNTSFSITQVAVKVPAIHPAAIYARAYTRLGVNVPDHIALAARSGWTDSVVANAYKDDFSYLTPIQIGSSILNVYLDTASANTWAYTAHTPGVGSHATYNSQSGTLLTAYYWKAKNGHGVIFEGRVFLDRVRLGRLMYPMQAIQVVDNIIPASAIADPNLAFDGIFGLAFSSRNTVRPVKQKTFFENIKGNLKAPLFAAYLKHKAPGAFDFGWIDPNKHKGSLIWTPVHTSQGLWNISVDGYSIGNDTFSTTPFFGIIDTATTLMLLDEGIVRDYYQRIPGSDKSHQVGGYVFTCTSILPEFKVKIGQHIAVVPGELINFTAINSTHCYGSIQVTPVPAVNLLGAAFIKTQFVVFHDRPGSPQIGIATQA
ncbi:hypothetical protein EYB26_001150 [Talaromyces marneffei]|uniref:uncharacterized protein n=1 Tax=Talaromyces marneffei TaxID=37727 RepID=UPI0012AA32A0|nr:uncharacterized protein EYB26_001150 [Talaromyces marneffei]QGA13500.1 hypothetical protein EYB26_001150 [Talaromyces marneffei]